ncbi:MFS transporter [Ramlibacter sp.]|uniref:MFS transporter n=1 Tax=Ramlibacter sp. TaxID=1917967 RepID=UPI003D0F7B18
MTPPARALRPLFLVVFLPFSTGYFLSFLFRSINAVIAPDLARDVGLGASGLGLLTAAFFIGFAAVQLPLGVMLDRWGAARVQAVLLVLAAAGSAAFAAGDGLASLLWARALIGIGCAGGLMAAFKSIVKWYPPQRLTFVNGCYLAVGGLGAIAATAPVEALLGVVSWRGVFGGLSVLCLVSAALIFSLVPRGDAVSDPPPLRTQLRELHGILRDPLFWRLVPVSLAGMGGTLAIQGLWVGPWLADGVGLDRGAVATRLLVLSIAMTAGFVLTGLVADALRTRGVSSLTTMAWGTALSIAALALITAGIDPSGTWHWIVFGLCGQVTAMVYPAMSRHFGAAFAGRAGTANTLVVFVGIFALQSAMGAIIDLWPRSSAGTYPPQAYQAAFAVVLAGLVLGLLWLVRPGKDREMALARVV